MEFRRGVSGSQASWSLYWLVATCIHVLLLVESLQDRKLQQASMQRRLQAYTDSTNATMHGPAVKSFQVSDGSWIDCVPIEQQIAAHHPALKDHIIQVSQSSYMDLQQNHVEPPSLGLHPQSFAREHGGCPEGCIPVQRKDSKQPLLSKFGSPMMHEQGTPYSHDYAVVGMRSPKAAYQGSSAVLSVHTPVVGDLKEGFSLSQLWISAGQYSDSSLNTAEVGWHVFPSHYPAFYPRTNKPLAPHLFIYWTADNYVNTGGYNLDTPGFVQTNNKWVLGGTIAENEDEISVVVVYESAIPGWRLSISGTTIGYWPSAIFTSLRTSANHVLWGGEIYNTVTSISRKATTMGSGAFPDKGYPVAAYQRNVKYADSSKKFFDATLKSEIVSNANCYKTSIQGGGGGGGGSGHHRWGTYFFFGGPGERSPACVKKYQMGIHPTTN
ncbi:hypothetical protein O6H91_12G037200 [Diphasiastrum complanatum]|uniref:Uncharacterized protein n=1 Tax=Diphasiastrum complanatum TaxID=34168 RepID=A0ACC2C0N6_DIPCM|nr:hypothetical protein O6H91_12G037200 [Diphasiastrum complanatum]